MSRMKEEFARIQSLHQTTRFVLDRIQGECKHCPDRFAITDFGRELADVLDEEFWKITRVTQCPKMFYKGTDLEPDWPECISRQGGTILEHCRYFQDKIACWGHWDAANKPRTPEEYR